MTVPHPERIDALFDQAAELARLLLKSSQPPRALTSEFLHARKRFLPTEKALISSLAHHALRCWRPAVACAREETGDVHPREHAAWSPEVLAASILLALPDNSPFHPPFPLPVEIADLDLTLPSLHDAAVRLLQRSDAPAADVVFVRAEELESAALRDTSLTGARWSLPEWMIAAWREGGEKRENGEKREGRERREGGDPAKRRVMADQDISAIGKAFLSSGPLCLRANSLRMPRETLLSFLADKGIPAEAHPLLPEAIIVHTRAALTDMAAYEDGLFEVQDAGSQVIALATGVSPGMRVYDACAGGGGKTVQLAGMMRDSGLLLASDIERNKLRGLRQRASRLALASLQTLAVTPSGDAKGPDETLPPEQSFDCVLVDAPCSGAGTFRRNPVLKWRLSEKTVARLAQRQEAILSRNAAYVRPGGVLVYATCSLLPEENLSVVHRFLNAHPSFTADPLLPAFHATDFHPTLSEHAWHWTVLPSILDSDGYFIARLRKT